MAWSRAECAIILAIAVLIACHSADAARILSVRRNTQQTGGSNSNTTVGFRPQARTLYSDGEGTYISSDSEHRYASGVKCWTDYFVVSQQLQLNSLERASDDVDCSSTSQCQINKMNGYQTCETWKTEETISAGVMNEIANFGVSVTLGHELQNCYTSSDTTSCTWTDMGCHSVWSQQQVLRQDGYARRRCTSDDGDYTAWMKDFSHEQPTNFVRYNCQQPCSAR